MPSEHMKRINLDLYPEIFKKVNTICDKHDIKRMKLIRTIIEHTLNDPKLIKLIIKSSQQNDYRKVNR
jgi:hypothetical protein